MRSPFLYRGEVDQLQEVASTNVAHLDDSHSSSRIFLGRLSWPHQTQYFAAMQSTDRHQDQHLVEAKGLHQNNFQRSARSYLQTLFLQKLWQSWRNVKDIFADLAKPNVRQDQMQRLALTHQ